MNWRSNHRDAEVASVSRQGMKNLRRDASATLTFVLPSGGTWLFQFCCRMAIFCGLTLPGFLPRAEAEDVFIKPIFNVMTDEAVEAGKITDPILVSGVLDPDHPAERGYYFLGRCNKGSSYIDFDGLRIDVESDQQHFLVAQLDPAGGVNWHRTIACPNLNDGRARLKVTDHALYVCGAFLGTMTVPGQPLTVSSEGGHHNGFVMKLDLHGTAEWITRVRVENENGTARSFCSFWDLDVNREGKIAVAAFFGTFTGNPTRKAIAWNSSTQQETTDIVRHSNSTSDRAVVLQLEANGDLDWAASAEAFNAEAVVYDNLGHIYVATRGRSASHTLHNGGELQKWGENETFIQKNSMDGYVFPGRLLYDNGHLYLSGDVRGRNYWTPNDYHRQLDAHCNWRNGSTLEAWHDGLIAKFKASDLSEPAAFHITACGKSSTIQGMDLDAQGNLYVVGTMEGDSGWFYDAQEGRSPILKDAPFSDHDVTAPNLFVAKFNHKLEMQWFTQPELTLTDPAAMGKPDIAVGPDNRLIVAWDLGDDVETRLELRSDGGLESHLTVPADDTRSALLALSAIGDFSESVQLTLDVPAALARYVQPEIGEHNFIKGTELVVQAPEVIYLDRGGNRTSVAEAWVRHVARRMWVDGVQREADTFTYQFVLNEDTEIRFDYDTEVALELLAEDSGADDSVPGHTGLDDHHLNALGDPDPAAGLKHWTPLHTELAPSVHDGERFDPLGGRYVLESYRRQTWPFRDALRCRQGLKPIAWMEKAIDLRDRSFTVATWVKRSAEDRGTAGGILTMDDGEGARQVELRFTSFDHFKFTVGTDELNAAGHFRDQEWHYLVCVYDAAAQTMQIYVDGALSAEKTGVSPVDRLANLGVGFRHHHGLSYFDGLLGRLSIWIRAQNAEEVAESMLQPPVGNEAELAGYWCFDRIRGELISDSRELLNEADANPIRLHQGFQAADHVVDHFEGIDETIPLDPREGRIQFSHRPIQAPSVITYTWKKQYRIQVSTVPLDGDYANAPRVEVNGNPDLLEGAGEHWIDAGNAVRVGSMSDLGNGELMNGWINAFGLGVDLNGDFHHPDLSSPANNLRFLPETVLRDRAQITWQYGEKVYTRLVALGHAHAPHVDAQLLADIRADYGDPGLTIPADQDPAIQTENGAINAIGWSAADAAMFALKPGITLAEFVTSDPEVKFVVRYKTGYPGDEVPERRAGEPATLDLLNTNESDYAEFHDLNVQALEHGVGGAQIHSFPEVDVDPDPEDAVRIHQVSHTEAEGLLVHNHNFVARRPGRSALFYTWRDDGGVPSGDLERERWLVRVVQTVEPIDPQARTPGTEEAVIGHPLPLTHDRANLESGFILDEEAPYNHTIYEHQNDSSSPTDAPLPQGPIVPVNTEEHAGGNLLEVHWYRTNELGVYWSETIITYDIRWPMVDTSVPCTNAQAEIEGWINLTSESGSENFGQPGYPLTEYADVAVYRQSDPGAPGYNPNEEHAFVGPSFASGAGTLAVFALRDDLNCADSSQPFVLVQFRDLAGEFGMHIYAVSREKCGEEFRYALTAGHPIHPPYPLRQITGIQPIEETVFRDVEADRTALWQDHNGLYWVSAGEEQLDGYFYYPLREDFDWSACEPGFEPESGQIVPWLPDDPFAEPERLSHDKNDRNGPPGDVARRYRDALAGVGDLSFPIDPPEAECVYHQVAVRTARRDALQAHLGKAGIGSSVHYPEPLHRQPALAGRLAGEPELPASEAAAAELLCLPAFPELTPAEVERVTEAVGGFFS